MDRKIMIIDDDFAFANYASLLIESLGLQAVLVHDATKALPLAKDIQPAVILTDASMPGKTGVELIRELKAEPATASIPILLCSITNERSEFQEAFRLGAMDFLPKPLRRDELKARLDEALRPKK